jgi:hypothetical protein
MRLCVAASTCHHRRRRCPAYGLAGRGTSFAPGVRAPPSDVDFKEIHRLKFFLSTTELLSRVTVGNGQRPHEEDTARPTVGTTVSEFRI